MKRNPRIQHLVPTAVHIKRDLTNCDPPPKPTQMWMCPRCDTCHHNLPFHIINYSCKCGWNGNRIDLLLAHDITPTGDNHA